MMPGLSSKFPFRNCSFSIKMHATAVRRLFVKLNLLEPATDATGLAMVMSRGLT